MISIHVISLIPAYLIIIVPNSTLGDSKFWKYHTSFFIAKKNRIII